MQLADYTLIRDEYGFDNMNDINEAIKAALHAATPNLSARLGTDFDPTTVVDTFYVPEPVFIDGPSVRTEFRLTNGFVKTLTSVKRADALDQFGGLEETSYAGDLTVAARDLERGVVRDFVTNYVRQFVKISYTAGFDPDGTDATKYNLTQVPGWLQRTALLWTKLQLASNPAFTEANIKIDTKTVAIELNSILGQKVRYAPVALIPM